MVFYRDILKQYWGYDSFRGVQEEIINSIGEGRDTLGLMPTGGGNHFIPCPGTRQRGLCIVITPLIALMKDQVQNLPSKGGQSCSHLLGHDAAGNSYCAGKLYLRRL